MDRFWDLLEKTIPYLFASASGLIGAVGGRWLDRRTRERDIKRQALIEVNKIFLVWADFGMAKLPFRIGLSEEYARDINDKMIEAKALLEVIGSNRLNLAFDDLQRATNGMVAKTMEYQQINKFDPNKGIEQFSNEKEYGVFRNAKKNWIDIFRKEIGADKVDVSKMKSSQGEV